MSRKCIYHLNYCLMTPKMKKVLIINLYLMFNLVEASVILLLRKCDKEKQGFDCSYRCRVDK